MSDRKQITEAVIANEEPGEEFTWADGEAGQLATDLGWNDEVDEEFDVEDQDEPDADGDEDVAQTAEESA